MAMNLDFLRERGTKLFKEKFNNLPDICACSPGRVNLIGEHTDYNGGFVFPMTIPLFTLVLGKKTSTGKCQILTTADGADEPHLAEFPLPTADNPLKPGNPKWANYVKGVVATFHGQLPSFNACIITSVPLGGGLSSSAALEVAMHTFLEALAGKQIENTKEKALACQKAEHTFAGMPCGIMDQFVCTLGKANHALLIDCLSMESRLVPLNNPEVTVLVVNSNVRHELTGSEYPTRKKQCEEAARILGKECLRRASLQDLEESKSKMSEVVYRRARHVISEVQRTTEAVTALERGDYDQFGKLMVESHKSLKDDYEVSCPELDSLVDAAMGAEGVYGSRMTGGGFGGCTVTLVHKDAVKGAIDNIKEKFVGRPTFYICSPVDGATLLKLK